MTSTQRSPTPSAGREGNSSPSAPVGSSVGEGSAASSAASRSSSERSSSSSGASTSARSATSSSGRSASSQRRARGSARTEIVAEGSMFPGAPERSDPQDGPGSHFPNPKVVRSLKRSALEKQYLLPAGYRIVFPEPDATVNQPPANCVAVYRAALEYGVRFPLHPVIVEILSKYEVALAQVVPTSWHNICSFIATCELRGLVCSARAFGLVHVIQKAPKVTGDVGWYCFNNRPGYMTAIEKKSKVKDWKYDFFFVKREGGWGDVPVWNTDQPIKNPFGAATAEEKGTARYFLYSVREDDRPRPIPGFMAAVVTGEEPSEWRRVRSTAKDPINWLPRLAYFKNDFFLAAAGLLIVEGFSRGIAFAFLMRFFGKC